MTLFSKDDKKYMKRALALAEDGLGQVFPNPSVGCVLVKDGKIIAETRTAKSGKPHAEFIALQDVGEQARGATAYVTLEPCAHEGKTPSCARKLAEYGIQRAVVACIDPDPRMNGKGLQIMRDLGIQVDLGLMEKEAKELNKGFFLATEQNRPMVTLKIATTLDGKIATSNGESKWITGEQARKQAHKERSFHDAVLVGIGTVEKDDPMLNVRLRTKRRQPVRVVLDSDLKITLNSKLVQSAKDIPLWVITAKNAHNDNDHKNALEAQGVTVLNVSRDQNGLNIRDVLELLSDKGITRLMVEGGRGVMTSFLQSGLYDRLAWFRAPSILGEEGLSGIGPMGITALSGKVNLVRKKARILGPDLLEIYER